MLLRECHRGQWICRVCTHRQVLFEAWSLLLPLSRCGEKELFAGLVSSASLLGLEFELSFVKVYHSLMLVLKDIHIFRRLLADEVLRLAERIQLASRSNSGLYLAIHHGDALLIGEFVRNCLERHGFFRVGDSMVRYIRRCLRRRLKC